MKIPDLVTDTEIFDRSTTGMEEDLSVSIIIITYNSELHIIDCINSLLAQTFGNVEIVVVDNNSTDNTISVIQKYFLDKVKPSQKEILLHRGPAPA